MASESNRDGLWDRRIGLRLLERSLAPRVVTALEGLGYTLQDDPVDDHEIAPSIWLVDEKCVEELILESLAPETRLIVLAAPRLSRTEVDDDLIAARLPRPGRLGTVYSTLQKLLESTPRRVPRVTTRLAARCIRQERRAIGAVLSLSEGGCLLRTPERLDRGTRVSLQFALPERGLVTTGAECRYTRQGDAGMAFDLPSEELRHSIDEYVTLQLSGPGAPAPISG